MKKPILTLFILLQISIISMAADYYWVGGTIKAIIHYDQVLRDPVIELDGKVLKI